VVFLFGFSFAGFSFFLFSFSISASRCFLILSGGSFYLLVLAFQSHAASRGYRIDPEDV
jgi:hypothetical protein